MNQQTKSNNQPTNQPAYQITEQSTNGRINKTITQISNQPTYKPTNLSTNGRANETNNQPTYPVSFFIFFNIRANFFRLNSLPRLSLPAVLLYHELTTVLCFDN